VPLVLHIAGNFAAIVIWALSTLVHDIYWRYGMWFSSIILEIVVLVVFSRRSSVTFAGSHLPERFALFTIIVLGEVKKQQLCDSLERSADTHVISALTLHFFFYRLFMQ